MEDAFAQISEREAPRRPPKPLRPSLGHRGELLLGSVTRMPLTFFAAGALLAAGVYAGSSAIAVPSAHGSTLHRSSISPQAVLNRIHRVLRPISRDSNVYRLTHARIRPTSAFLSANSGGFTTNCRHAGPHFSTYRHFKITPRGAGYRSCHWGPAILKDIGPSEPGQFQRPLDHIGAQIARSVQSSADPLLGTKMVRGDRKRITIEYVCPNEAGSPTSVRQIVLRRRYKTVYRHHRKRRHRSTAAMIVPC